MATRTAERCIAGGGAEGKAEGHARIRACPGRRDADAHNATDRPQYVHCRLEDLPREDLWM